jgi:hypothetical protein
MNLLFSNQWGLQHENPAFLDYTNVWMGPAYAAGAAVLRRMAGEHGIMCSPMRSDNRQDADAFCIWEAPRVATNERNEERYEFIMKTGKPIYAFLTEPNPVDSENDLLSNTLFYDRMFTWRPHLIDYVKYFPIRPMTFEFDMPAESLSYCDRKLCVIIGHILSNIFTSKSAIYNRRKDVLDWFSATHPGDIDLYGKQPYGVGKIMQYPFYKGPSQNKRVTLAAYRFSFCYENSCYDDYITEKIFDCFLSGCVPIYIGAPNILDYVPHDSFIDPDSFDSMEDLYRFLSLMDEKQYKRYLDAARDLLTTPFAQSYKPDAFAGSVLSVLCKDLGVAGK